MTLQLVFIQSRCTNVGVQISANDFQSFHSHDAIYFLLRLCGAQHDWRSRELNVDYLRFVFLSLTSLKYHFEEALFFLSRNRGMRTFHTRLTYC